MRITRFSRLFILAISLNLPVAKAEITQYEVRKFGDYAQVINPLLVAAIATQEKGLGHFAFIYGQAYVTMQAIKLAGKGGKIGFSKRPEKTKNKYDGMPSGHTTSAWVAAAYMRSYSENYKFMAIPLYFTAAMTAYSRVISNRHTSAQVVAAAILSEAFVYFNKKLKWSNEYRAVSFNVGGNNEYSAGLTIKF